MELRDSGSAAFSRYGYAAASPGVAAGAKHCGIPGITKSYSARRQRKEAPPWASRAGFTDGESKTRLADRGQPPASLGGQ